MQALAHYTWEAVEWSYSDHILTLTLNRPERKNAINPTMANELLYGLQVAETTPDIRVVVLAAHGDIYCAGGDLNAMRGGGSESRSTVPESGQLQDISLRLRSVRKPVIAKIQGNVMAGALMLTCNATHAIAADHVTFSAPEIKRGLWPYMVMAGLFRVMPRRAALDFIMRGYSLPAARALELGLATQLVTRDQLEAEVDKLARELASFSPATMRLGLEAYYHQDTLDFEQAIPYLMEMLARTIGTEDAREGIAAFLEKRPPVWTGR